MPYLGKTPSQATRQRYYKTASGGETSISGTMTTGGTLTFTDGEFVDVSLNGVALVAGTDYNTTTANTIGGLSALSANDQVEIVVYDTFSVFGGNVNGDFNINNGTLAAEAVTLNGTAITATATLDTGISNNNVPKFTSGVADNDFLRVDGTAIEGRSASEVLSDIGALANLSEDATPQLGGHLDTNGYNINFGDNDTLSFGAGSDLTINHTGANSFITDSGTGALYIQGTNGVFIRSADGGENLASFTDDGSVALNHDNTTRIETTSSGVDITGGFTATDGCTITTADNDAQLTLTSTDADASVGPLLDMIRDSSSPADSDTLGRIRFRGDNSAGEVFTYGTITSKITDASDSTEGGLLTFLVARNGSITSALDLNETETVFNEGSLDADFRVEGNGNANAFFVQGSDDFIGIGTGAPKKKLHIQDTTSDGIIILDRNGTSTDHQICFAHNYQSGGQSGGNYYAIGVDGSENKLVFAFDPDSQASLSADAKMVLDSSGRVGIGTNSPTLDSSLAGLSISSSSTLLHVNDIDGACLKLSDPDTGSNRGLGLTIQGQSAAISNCENGELRFGTGNAERMRIDASGRLMVGKTSSSIAIQGAVITDDGRVDITPTTTNGSGQTDAIRLHNTGTTAGDGAGIKFSAGTSTTGAGIFGIGQALNSANLVFRAGGDTERMRIDTSGNLIIGATQQSGPDGGNATGIVAANNGRFYISSLNGSNVFEFNVTGTGGVGSIHVNTSGTAYNTSSDYRLKQGVEDMTGAIDRVKALAPKRFQFIADPDTTVDGFLAHEAQTVVPEAITGTHNEVKTWTQQEIDDGDAPDGTSAGDNKLDGDGKTIPVMQGIDQSKLVPLLTGALQEAIAKIETLETKVAALEAGE